LSNVYGGELYFHSLRCNDPHDARLGDFKQTLLTIAKKSQRSINPSLLEAAEKLKKDFYKKPVIKRNRLRHRLKNDFDNIDITINQLEGLGYLVSVGNDTQTKDYDCLNPTWTIDYAYRLLFLDNLDKNNGLISHTKFDDELFELSESVSDDLPEIGEKGEVFLKRFLIESGICTALDNRQQLFFADKAPANEPDWLNNQKATIHLDLILPYFPMGLGAKLVAIWLHEGKKKTTAWIKRAEDVWREGFILHHRREDQSYLVIRYQIPKASLNILAYGNDYQAIAELCVEFWQFLEDKINPIQANDVYPLFKMDKRFLTKDNELKKVSELFSNSTIFADSLKKEQSMSITVNQNKNDVKGDGNNTASAAGNNNRQNQTQTTEDNHLNEQQKAWLTQAIEEIRRKEQLYYEQHNKLDNLYREIEQGKISDKSLYQKFRDQWSLAADTATITAATFIPLIIKMIE
jgi:hypothetical protein